MGEKIKLLWPEYEYELPKMPSDEKDILFFDKKKEDQFWRRPPMPDLHQWNNSDVTKKFLFLERERERWLNGVWFFNNGVPTYITGKHYDHLTYQNYGYRPQYYDHQRHDWYFRDLIKKDPYSFGGLKIKPRRYGATDEECTDSQCEAINGSDKKIGMMSETRDKVYSTIYDKITASYIQRAPILKPSIFMRNAQVPKKKLEFRPNKVKQIVMNGQTDYEVNVALNSLIEPKATTVIGYDGWKLHKLTMDEIWKWTACSPQACWNKQRECLQDGGDIIGYAMLLSTMGDDEDYEDAIKDGISMWEKSNPFERDGNGYTDTGLYRYFISGLYAFRKFADLYGFVNVDQAEQTIMNRRKRYVEGTLEYLFEVRKYPLNIEECLDTALVTGVFDTKRIEQTITIINKTPMSERPYFAAELIEDNQGKIHVEPDKSGSNAPWLISILPHRTPQKDYSNRWKKFDNQILAPKNPEGAIGYDPIRYADTDVSSGTLSMAAILAAYKFDYFRKERSKSAAGKFAAMYLNRPEDPEEAHYEAYKCGKLYGFPIMYERQVESFLRRMRELFFTDFLLTSPKDGKFGMWTDNQHKVVKTGIDLLQSRWKKPKELWLPDRLAETPFIPLLSQAGEFNPRKTTKFDAMMAAIMLEHGLLQIYESSITDDYDPEEIMKQAIGQLFPKRK